HGEREVKLEVLDAVKCKLAGIGKKGGRPRNKGKELSLASAECCELEAQLTAARADLAIEE
ncbi:unnamed protein product, partial [Prorocentrum cordatum]